MATFKLRTTIEIELDIEAQSKEEARKLADAIELSATLDNLPKSVNRETDIYISCEQEVADWDIEQEDDIG